MHKSTKLVALLGALIIVVGACTTAASPTPAGSEAPASQAPASEAPASQAPATEAPTQAPAGLSGTVTAWHSYGSSGGGAEFKAWTRISEAIVAANPDLKLDSLDVPFDQIFKKFEAESAAGGGPDMFIAPNDNFGNEVRGGFLANLDGKIDDVVANSSDVAVAGSKVNGQLFMVPESLKAVAMNYDSTKVPNPPKTTDELMAFVKNGGKVGLISGNYFGWGFYGSFGGKIFDENGKCAATANTGVGDAIQFYADLKAAGALVDADYGKVNDAFKSGKIDIIFNGNWTLGDYKTARPALAVANGPTGPGGGAFSSLVGVDGWYINSAVSAEQQALAIGVASEAVGPAAQQLYTDIAGHVPANKTVTVIDPLVKAFSDSFLQGTPRPQTKEFGNYWTPFGDAWNQVLDKGADPQQAVATACATMDKANGK
jgi:arabinogalactan oligomer/maltooligosaccharide transport system substrate-binding protein